MKIKPLLDLCTFVRVAIAGHYRFNHPFEGDGAHHAVGARWEIQQGVVGAVCVVLGGDGHFNNYRATRPCSGAVAKPGRVLAIKYTTGIPWWYWKREKKFHWNHSSSDKFKDSPPHSLILSTFNNVNNTSLKPHYLIIHHFNVSSTKFCVAVPTTQNSK